MAATTAIASTAAAASSATIVLASTNMIHVYADEALGPGETVTLEISPDGGTTWYQVLDDQYRGVVLNDVVANQTVGGPGTYRLTKTATSVAVEVYYE